MNDTVLDALAPLAGVCSYERAAEVGVDVEGAVARLLRLHWVEKRLFEIMVARIPSTPEWELKGALALHQWYAAEHADLLRRRVGEMRSPVPRLDRPPDPALEAFLAEVAAAPSSSALVVGLYGVALPALAEAYATHAEELNPLIDHPSHRTLRLIRPEVEAAAAWGAPVVAALADQDADASALGERLRTFLSAAGGVLGSAERCSPLPPSPPPPSDFTPRRDPRFQGAYNFNFPPHVLYAVPELDPDERNLALLCKRLLEMDVPEMMASFLTERRDRPWEFYLDYSRQLWDEARHSMLGEVALEARGIDWRSIPLNVGFSLRLNLHADPLERQLVLWAIEQGLMPGDTGKRFEYETARSAGDPLSAHIHDFDWADEVLHARIGRRWLLGAEGEGLTHDRAMAAGQAIHERTWAALAEYRDREPQEEWWTRFVEAVLGRPSGARPEHLAEEPHVINAKE